MPEWMDKCVASYQEKHPDDDESTAWAVCTTMFQKKFGHDPGREDVAENLLALQEAVGTESLQLTFSDGEKREVIRNALEVKFQEESDGIWTGYWYIVSVYETHVVVYRDVEQRLFAIPYSIVDRHTAELGEPVEVVAAHVQEETAVLHLLMFEGWLPPGTTATDLEDGDFAWLSDEYRAADDKSRRKMDKRVHRQLPYKIAGETHLYGWMGAMKALNWRSYLRLNLEGGPDRKQLRKVLMQSQPDNICFDEDGVFSISEESGKDVVFEAALSDFVLEEMTPEEQDRFAYVFSANAIPPPNTEYGVHSKNRRLYPPSAVDETYDRTHMFLQEGGVATIYTSHTAAMPAAARLPVGKVLDVSRAGAAVKVRGGIVDTTEGQDAIKLLEAEVLGTISLRTHEWESHMEEIGDLGRLEVIDWCVIQGVDFTSSPGLPGTQVHKEEQEDKTMELKELTLEELNSQRPDLVEELLAGHTAEPTFETPPDVALELAILQAASAGMASVVASKLRDKVEAIEDIAEHVEAARTEAIQEVYRGRQTEAKPAKMKGVATPAADLPPREEKPEQQELTETQQEILAGLGATV